MTDRIQLCRALPNVYGKEGLEELATALHAVGVELVSTGSTATRVAAAGISVIPVEQLTRFPECLDGRVKTLHPCIHAGILADRRLPVHVSQLEELGVAPFDLVVVNLYPFEAAAASGAGTDKRVEQIDIGGPSMARVAVKNHLGVAVVTSTSQYPAVPAALVEGGFTLQQRRDLAAEVLRYTVSYGTAVASWMGAIVVTPAGDGFPAWLGAAWVRKQDLCYGENSHQAATLYTYPLGPEGIVQAELLHGKLMSYNDYTDGEAAYRAVNDFTEPCVAIIKHTSPCGIAVGSDVAEAHRKVHVCDLVFAFSEMIAANRPITAEPVEQIEDISTKAVIAPGSDPEVLVILTMKKNLRLLKAVPYTHRERTLHPISGGALFQRSDRVDAPDDDSVNWELKADETVDDAALADLVFAWRVCRVVKFNAILLAHDGASVGVGMGQVSHVNSHRLAVERAGERAAGLVVASDAFFPLADGPRILIDGGVRAIVQLGSSLHNQGTIDPCVEHGVMLYFAGIRYLSHRGREDDCGNL